jgi:PIN domain nuclease of toxin-antitoxin system
MSGLLLDTHVVLWLLDDSPRLGIQARDRITGSAAVYVSAASMWELAIKAAIGKVTLPDNLGDAIDRSALRDLPVTRRHTLASDLTALPLKDPFDAVLVARRQWSGSRCSRPTRSC